MHALQIQEKGVRMNTVSVNIHPRASIAVTLLSVKYAFCCTSKNTSVSGSSCCRRKTKAIYAFMVLFACFGFFPPQYK